MNHQPASSGENPNPAPPKNNAARGFFLITGAKAWFFVAGVILNFGLPLAFQTQAEYGTYNFIINIVSILNMVVITGTLQTVSKMISETPDAAQSLLHQVLKLQLVVGGSIALGYFLLSESLAAWLHAPEYGPLLQLSALIVAAYSFYAIFIGYFNGTQQFARQAGLDIIFATLRVVCMLTAVAVGWSVAGAVGGFALAAAIILTISAIWVTLRLRKVPSKEPSHVSSRRLLVYLLTTMFYMFVVNGLIRVDLLILKRASATALTLLGEQGAEASNALVGSYTLMLNIARLPYQAVIALTFVIFPMISRSTFEGDDATTRTYLNATTRYALMMVGGLASVFAGVGADAVLAIYPGYFYATQSLPVLCVAYASFALFYVACTILIAAGRPGHATAVSLVTLIAASAGSWFWINAQSPGVDMISASSLIMAITLTAGLGLAAFTIQRQYGAFLPWKRLFRLLSAAAIVILIGQLTRFDLFLDLTPINTFDAILNPTDATPTPRNLLLFLGAAFKGLILTIIYLGTLLAIGEIDSAERSKIYRKLQRLRPS